LPEIRAYNIVVVGSAQRVLVCDDERHITRLIQVSLERQGHEVVCSYTGQEALDVASRQHFDVAVVDTRLPDMTGKEVKQRLRENPQTSHIRIILIGIDEDRDDSDDDGPGSDLFLTKPFNPMRLVGL
jgi:two-component system, OmpR family, alkaline phosphatase synthesis response regulator PhoP